MYSSGQWRMQNKIEGGLVSSSSPLSLFFFFPPPLLLPRPPHISIDAPGGLEPPRPPFRSAPASGAILHMHCNLKSSQSNICRINGTSGNDDFFQRQIERVVPNIEHV